MKTRDQLVKQARDFLKSEGIDPDELVESGRGCVVIPKTI